MILFADIIAYSIIILALIVLSQYAYVAFDIVRVARNRNGFVRAILLFSISLCISTLATITISLTSIGNTCRMIFSSLSPVSDLDNLYFISLALWRMGGLGLLALASHFIIRQLRRDAAAEKRERNA